MDELFALVIALTFLLSLIISSLVLLLVWIAIPEINNHKALVVVIILGLSAPLLFTIPNRSIILTNITRH